jgi:hypothetical protein
VLVLVSFGLLLAATATLVVGLLADDSLWLIYLSIGLSALAALTLIIAVRTAKPTPAWTALVAPVDPEPSGPTAAVASSVGAAQEREEWMASEQEWEEHGPGLGAGVEDEDDADADAGLVRGYVLEAETDDDETDFDADVDSSAQAATGRQPEWEPQWDDDPEAGADPEWEAEPESDVQPEAEPQSQPEPEPDIVPPPSAPAQAPSPTAAPAERSTAPKPARRHAARAPYGPGSAAPGPRGGRPKGYAVKGDAESMRYCVPGSPSYGSTRADVFFASEEDAQRAGFSAAPGPGPTSPA